MRMHTLGVRSHRPSRVVPLLCLIAIAAAASLAQAAEDPLVLGIFPRYRATQVATMYAPLAEHLGARLERKVTLVTSRDFESFWDGVMEHRYDIVHYNQYHYIRSARTYEVIAHSQEFGKDAVAGALYVRRDSGISEISQLRGRTVIFGGGRDAMLSYIAPMYLLLQAGLKEGDFKIELAVSPPNTLLALYRKQADAAGGGDILIDLPVVKKAIDPRDIRILATTEPLLFLPWAVKRAMPAKLRQSIQTILIELHSSDTGRTILKSAGTTRLGRASDSDYDPHRRMTRAVFGPTGAAR